MSKELELKHITEKDIKEGEEISKRFLALDPLSKQLIKSGLELLYRRSEAEKKTA